MPTQESLYPRHRIKSSKLSMYRTLHVGIRLARSADDRHQTNHAQMSCGVCASAGWHQCRATIESINQGLCALGKKCWPTERDISHAILVVDRPHWSWIVQIAPSMFVVDCPYLLWLLHIRSFIVERGLLHRSGDITCRLRSSGRWHHLCPERIDQATSPNGMLQQPRPTCINLCIYASTQWQILSVHAFSRRRRPTTCCINQSLHASGVVYAHLESNTGQGHEISYNEVHRLCNIDVSNKRHHHSRIVCYGQVASANGTQHQLRP